MMFDIGYILLSMFVVSCGIYYIVELKDRKKVLDLSGKTVWITGKNIACDLNEGHYNIPFSGASSGIGKALAVEFVRMGCDIVISGRDERKLAEVANECNCIDALCLVLCVPFDVSNLSDIPDIVSGAHRLLRENGRSGDISVLVNNAGVSSRGLAEETELSTLQHILGLVY